MKRRGVVEAENEVKWELAIHGFRRRDFGEGGRQNQGKIKLNKKYSRETKSEVDESNTKTCQSVCPSVCLSVSLLVTLSSKPREINIFEQINAQGGIFGALDSSLHL